MKNAPPHDWIKKICVTNGGQKIRLRMKWGEGHTATNKRFAQLPGSVSSLLSFSLFTLCRGTGRNWSGLTFRFAPFLSPPIPATAQTQTLAVIGPGLVGHLTGDTLPNKDFPRGQVKGFVTTWTLKKKLITLDKWDMKWSTLRIFKKSRPTNVSSWNRFTKKRKFISHKNETSTKK